MFELVCVTYIFPVRACDCLWCLPESTGALAVLCGVSGSGSDVAVGCLVCMFLGDLFPVGFGRLALFSCDFWVANVTSEKVLVYEIPTFWLSGNRQEKARKWSLIFSKLNFTVWYKCCGYFMFFIFELQLWKKLVFEFASVLFDSFLLRVTKFCICLAIRWVRDNANCWV